MPTEETYVHKRLDCGVELAALPIEGRRTIAFEIRILAGISHEPEDKLGLAYLMNETISKGTQQRTAQELTDAFDAIGAQCNSSAGRESFIFQCSCLPEYLDEALELHAEMLRTPTFPDEFCQVAVHLAHQELIALEDDPGELSRRLLAPRAYGRRLGRHALGTHETLDRIKRDDIFTFWREHFSAARMQIALSGAVEVDQVARQVDRLFAGFGDSAHDGRGAFPIEFSPGTRHRDKALEQEHILICWPGVKITDDDYAVERTTLAILGGGMSSRLFAEVRERQGLVYWVGAWDEHPRGAGLMFVGASTTPARCDQTFRTLLGEVDRLAANITEKELERAKVGLIARTQTHGDITRARSGELSRDLFHYGRPVPFAEKNARIAAVTVADVRRYLHEHPRDELCVQTLGPQALGGSAEDRRDGGTENRR